MCLRYLLLFAVSASACGGTPAAPSTRAQEVRHGTDTDFAALRCDEGETRTPRYAQRPLRLLVGSRAARHTTSVPIGFGPVSATFGEAADPRAEPFPGGYFLQHADRSSLDSVIVHTAETALSDAASLAEPMREMLQQRGFSVHGHVIEELTNTQALRFDLVMPSEDGVPPRCARVYAVWYPDHIWLVDCVWRPEFGPDVRGACSDAVEAPRMEDAIMGGRSPDVGGPESVVIGGALDPMRLFIPLAIVPIAHADAPTNEAVSVGFTDISMIAEPTAIVHIEVREGFGPPPSGESELEPFARAVSRSAGVALSARFGRESQGRVSVILEGMDGETTHRWILVWRGEEVALARCHFGPGDDRVAAACFSMMNVE